MVATNKRITEGNLDSFKRYLNKGFIPVIYGDVVLDKDLEICVISGDQIIQYLAKNLNPDKVILGTDVDGVYNKNPKIHDDAVFFDKFSSLEDLDTLEGTTNVDVTGGMVGKIKELLYLADLGIESKIINAEIENNIFKALNNDQVKGTVISRDNKNMISDRKLEHLLICKNYDVEFKNKKTGFEDVELIHKALPEIDKNDIDLSTSVFGKN